ncbi:MAG: molybdenum cofactor guanylyltransferase [Sphingopyxis sp.]|nr:molybdenum cofactor guanylyltransferase [Sphingopyxis sp.]
MSRSTVGVVLAGGRASRFGRDKAAELYRGRMLLDWSIGALQRHCDIVVVAGRDHPTCCSVPDRPRPGLGPLGGIAGALYAAWTEKFDQVLSLPCDTPHVPQALLTQLAASAGPAFVERCPVIGLWPASLSPRLDIHLANGGAGGVRRWAKTVGAVALTTTGPIWNINTPGDLASLAADHGRD